VALLRFNLTHPHILHIACYLLYIYCTWHCWHCFCSRFQVTGCHYASRWFCSFMVVIKPRVLKVLNLNVTSKWMWHFYLEACLTFRVTLQKQRIWFHAGITVGDKVPLRYVVEIQVICSITLCWLINIDSYWSPWHWRWQYYAPVKFWYLFTSQHIPTFQKTWIFISITVKASNFTTCVGFCKHHLHNRILDHGLK
jgi:hypothetical protein